MFIELAEFLRCPESHDLANLVLVADTMVGRGIVAGSVGCPVCRREYPIRDGIADFGGDSWPPDASPSPPPVDPLAVQALLGLGSPGGHVVLVGSASYFGRVLADLIEGVHFVGFGAPPGVGTSPALSVLRCARSIPLRPGTARGVVLGTEHATPPWLSESARLVLRGQRLVTLTDVGKPPNGIEMLAAGQGMWVGRKR